MYSMSEVCSQNSNLLIVECLLCSRDPGITGIAIQFQTSSSFLLAFLCYEEETSFFKIKNTCENISLIYCHQILSMLAAQCVSSVAGVLKAVKKGMLHPEPTPGGNGSWERAAEEYSLFCREFPNGEPAHGTCPCSLIFISFSGLTGIEINLITFELSPTAYKRGFHSTIREKLTLKVSVE